MARVLGTTRNSLTLFDNISNSEIILYYRNPTTAERNGYANMAMQRKRNKIKFNQAKARLTYGLAILLGFREGDFVRSEGGREVTFSSDKESPHYKPDWKEELEKGAADLVMLLAAHVFDVSAEIQDEEEEEYPDDEEDADPNSGKTLLR